MTVERGRRWTQIVPMTCLIIAIVCLFWIGDTFRTAPRAERVEYCGSLFDTLSPGGFVVALALSIVGGVAGYLYYRRWFWWMIPVATAIGCLLLWNT